jgi:hypothetical protein
MRSDIFTTTNQQPTHNTATANKLPKHWRFPTIFRQRVTNCVFKQEKISKNNCYTKRDS